MLLTKKIPKHVYLKKAHKCKSVHGFSYVTKHRFGKFNKVYYFNFHDDNIIFNVLEKPLQNYLIKQEFAKSYNQKKLAFKDNLLETYDNYSLTKLKNATNDINKYKIELFKDLILTQEDKLYYYLNGFDENTNKKQVGDLKFIKTNLVIINEIRNNDEFVLDVINTIENYTEEQIVGSDLVSLIARYYYKDYREAFNANFAQFYANYKSKEDALGQVLAEYNSSAPLVKSKVTNKLDVLKKLFDSVFNIKERVLLSLNVNYFNKLLNDVEEIVNISIRDYKRNLYIESVKYIILKQYKGVVEPSVEKMNYVVQAYNVLTNIETIFNDYKLEFKTIFNNIVKISKLEHDILKIKKINKKLQNNYIDISNKLDKIVNLKTLNESLLVSIENIELLKASKTVLGSVSSNLLTMNENLYKGKLNNDQSLFTEYNENIASIKFETNVKRYAEYSKCLAKLKATNFVLNNIVNTNKLLDADFAKVQNDLVKPIIAKIQEEIRNTNGRLNEILSPFSSNSKMLGNFVKSYVKACMKEFISEPNAFIRQGVLLAYVASLLEKQIVTEFGEFVKVAEVVAQRANKQYVKIEDGIKTARKINFKAINTNDLISAYIAISEDDSVSKNNEKQEQITLTQVDKTSKNNVNEIRNKVKAETSDESIIDDIEIEKDPQVLAEIERQKKSRQFIEQYTLSLVESFKKASAISKVLEEKILPKYRPVVKTEQVSETQNYEQDTLFDYLQETENTSNKQVDTSEINTEESKQETVETEQNLDEIVPLDEEIAQFTNDISKIDTSSIQSEIANDNEEPNLDEEKTQEIEPENNQISVVNEISEVTNQVNGVKYEEKIAIDTNQNIANEEIINDDDLNAILNENTKQDLKPKETVRLNIQPIANDVDDEGKVHKFNENLPINGNIVYEQITKEDEQKLQEVSEQNLLIEKYKPNKKLSRKYNIDDEKDYNSCKNDVFWKMQLRAIKEKVNLEATLNDENMEEFANLATVIKLFEIAASDNLNYSEVNLEKLGKLTYQQLARLTILKYKEGKIKNNQLMDIINHMILNTINYSKGPEYNEKIKNFLRRRDIKMVLLHGFVSLDEIIEKEIESQSELNFLYNYFLQKTAPKLFTEEKTIEKTKNDGIIV